MSIARRLAALAVPLAIAGLAAAGCATSAADTTPKPTPEQRYLQMVHKDEVTGSDKTLVKLGREYCSDVSGDSSGTARELARNYLVLDGPYELTASDVDHIIYAATHTFCPGAAQ